MNNEPKQTLTITLNGTFTIAPDQLEQFFRRLPVPASPVVEVPAAEKVEGDGKPPRLAYSTREVAEILGVSSGTVRRLLRRRLLKSSSALRCNIISRAEIERFLKETTQFEC